MVEITSKEVVEKVVDIGIEISAFINKLDREGNVGTIDAMQDIILALIHKIAQLEIELKNHKHYVYDPNRKLA